MKKVGTTIPKDDPIVSAIGKLLPVLKVMFHQKVMTST